MLYDINHGVTLIPQPADTLNNFMKLITNSLSTHEADDCSEQNAREKCHSRIREFWLKRKACMASIVYTVVLVVLIRTPYQSSRVERTLVDDYLSIELIL